MPYKYFKSKNDDTAPENVEGVKVSAVVRAGQLRLQTIKKKKPTRVAVKAKTVRKRAANLSMNTTTLRTNNSQLAKALADAKLEIKRLGDIVLEVREENQELTAQLRAAEQVTKKYEQREEKLAAMAMAMVNVLEREDDNSATSSPEPQLPPDRPSLDALPAGAKPLQAPVMPANSRRTAKSNAPDLSVLMETSDIQQAAAITSTRSSEDDEEMDEEEEEEEDEGLETVAEEVVAVEPTEEPGPSRVSVRRTTRRTSSLFGYADTSETARRQRTTGGQFVQEEPHSPATPPDPTISPRIRPMHPTVAELAYKVAATPDRYAPGHEAERQKFEELKRANSSGMQDMSSHSTVDMEETAVAEQQSTAEKTAKKKTDAERCSAVNEEDSPISVRRTRHKPNRKVVVESESEESGSDDEQDETADWRPSKEKKAKKEKSVAKMPRSKTRKAPAEDASSARNTTEQANRDVFELSIPETEPIEKYEPVRKSVAAQQNGSSNNETLTVENVEESRSLTPSGLLFCDEVDDETPEPPTQTTAERKKTSRRSPIPRGTFVVPRKPSTAGPSSSIPPPPPRETFVVPPPKVSISKAAPIPAVVSPLPPPKPTAECSVRGTFVLKPKSNRSTITISRQSEAVSADVSLRQEAVEVVKDVAGEEAKKKTPQPRGRQKKTKAEIKGEKAETKMEKAETKMEKAETKVEKAEGQSIRKPQASARSKKGESKQEASAKSTKSAEDKSLKESNVVVVENEEDLPQENSMNRASSTRGSSQQQPSPRASSVSNNSSIFNASNTDRPSRRAAATVTNYKLPSLNVKMRRNK